MLNGGTAVREAWLGYTGTPPTPTVSLVVCVCTRTHARVHVCVCVSGKLLPGAISFYLQYHQSH